MSKEIKFICKNCGYTSTAAKSGCPKCGYVGLFKDIVDNLPDKPKLQENNKCCDNCEHNNKKARDSGRNKKYLCRELGEQLWRENWDTSKDYCSKWAKKEDTLLNELSAAAGYKGMAEYGRITINDNTINIHHAIKYFKQRIKESLEKASGHNVEINGVEYIVKENMIDKFSWILD